MLFWSNLIGGKRESPVDYQKIEDYNQFSNFSKKFNFSPKKWFKKFFPKFSSQPGESALFEEGFVQISP